ncbi:MULTISPECIES: hypothetical protein [unclassified Carboxylicivirga]|uniref:hypothetical protein n=1 Tax=Carboxylicivirga TaxID=1628153 RepID=UPI003D32B8A7
MKKVLILLSFILLLLGCKTTYETSVSGLENIANIKVVKANKTLNPYSGTIMLFIDNEAYEIEKLFSEKKSLKASTYSTSPGEHVIVVTENDKTIYEKKVFIDNRETRIIILK